MSADTAQWKQVLICPVPVTCTPARVRKLEERLLVADGGHPKAKGDTDERVARLEMVTAVRAAERAAKENRAAQRRQHVLQERRYQDALLAYRSQTVLLKHEMGVHRAQLNTDAVALKAELFNETVANAATRRQQKTDDLAARSEHKMEAATERRRRLLDKTSMNAVLGRFKYYNPAAARPPAQPLSVLLSPAKAVHAASPERLATPPRSPAERQASSELLHAQHVNAIRQKAAEHNQNVQHAREEHAQKVKSQARALAARIRGGQLSASVLREQAQLHGLDAAQAKREAVAAKRQAQVQARRQLAQSITARLCSAAQRKTRNLFITVPSPGASVVVTGSGARLVSSAEGLEPKCKRVLLCNAAADNSCAANSSAPAPCASDFVLV